MDEKQLQAIEDRCQRNQGRNDGMIRQDVMDLLAEVRRLQMEAIKLRNCNNCKKPCMKGPVETELTVLDRMDNCKANGRSKWEAAGNG